jgi:DNA-binding NarL/FixJ family response regulator
VILSADLMFGSRLLSSLTEAGNEVELLGNEAALRERLSGHPDAESLVLIADLTDDRFEGVAMLESVRAEGLPGKLRTLAFYSHVEADVRVRAQAAGFDLVVPRSRMAREAAAVVNSLV